MVALPYPLIAPLLEATWHARLQGSGSAVGLRYIMYPWVVDNAAFLRADGLFLPLFERRGAARPLRELAAVLVFREEVE